MGRPIDPSPTKPTGSGAPGADAAGAVAPPGATAAGPASIPVVAASSPASTFAGPLGVARF